MIHIGGFLITESAIPTYYGKEKSHVPRLGTPCAILYNLGMYLLAHWRLDTICATVLNNLAQRALHGTASRRVSY